ncbi:MAG: hypothetical protein ACFFD6_05680 [Candidatus Thorarchaeota archaeon]
MNRWTLKAQVIGFSLMIFFGGTAAVATINYPYYLYSETLLVHSHIFTFNVTVDEPQWNITFDYWFMTEIGISELQTNSTSVTVHFMDERGYAVLTLSNLTKVMRVNLTVPAWRGDDFTIKVERENADATVDIIILVWELIPPPPVAIPFIRPLLLFWSAIAVVGTFALVVLSARRRKGERGNRPQDRSLRKRIQPYWIAILVLLNIFLTAPYIAGSLDGSFIPVEHTDNVTGGSQVFTLTQTSSTGILGIGPGVEGSPTIFSINSHENAGMKYRMELQNPLGETLLNGSCVNSSVSWMIEGQLSGIENSTLVLERIDSDAEIGFSYIVTLVVLRPEVDPLPITIQAYIGGVLLLMALILGIIIEPPETSHSIEDEIGHN